MTSKPIRATVEFQAGDIDGLVALLKDGLRYRRLRENWLDVEEIGLHGRTVVIDKRVDELLDHSQQP